MTTAAHRPIRRMLARQLRWVAVLLVGCALYVAVLVALLGTHDVVYVPALLLVGTAIVPVTFVTAVGLRGRTLSASTVAVTAALGGVVAIVIAGSLEYLIARHLGSLPMWSVGVVEETAKLAVPALILLRRKPQPLDGIILGVAAGSCFAVLETMGYAFVVLLQSRGNLEAVTDLLVIRSVAEPGGHAAWTGLACAALFAVWSSRRRWLGWLRFLLVYTSVVCLHATWDTLRDTHGYLLVGAVSFTALMAATLWLHSSPARQSLATGATRQTRRTPDEDPEIRSNAGDRRSALHRVGSHTA